MLRFPPSCHGKNPILSSSGQEWRPLSRVSAPLWKHSPIQHAGCGVCLRPYGYDKKTSECRSWSKNEARKRELFGDYCQELNQLTLQDFTCLQCLYPPGQPTVLQARLTGDPLSDIIPTSLHICLSLSLFHPFPPWTAGNGLAVPPGNVKLPGDHAYDVWPSPCFSPLLILITN